MQLQMNLVAQDVLAQWAADHRLHRVLGHHMKLHAVGVFAAVIAVRTLLDLKIARKQNGRGLERENTRYNNDHNDNNNTGKA